MPLVQVIYLMTSSAVLGILTGAAACYLLYRAAARIARAIHSPTGLVVRPAKGWLVVARMTSINNTGY